MRLTRDKNRAGRQHQTNGRWQKHKVVRVVSTPFNLLRSTKRARYIRDYVMEQSAKQNWITNNYCDSNPYETLPRLNIYTYNLNKLITGYEDFEDKAFNFREFFRTWSGDVVKDKKHIPENAKIGISYTKRML